MSIRPNKQADRRHKNRIREYGPDFEVEDKYDPQGGTRWLVRSKSVPGWYGWLDSSMFDIISKQLVVPLEQSHNIRMKKIINEDGFKEAMKDGRDWTTLSLDMTEGKDGTWYWEIEKSIFHGGETDIDKKVSYELLSTGYGWSDVEAAWSDLISELNPDEYFVDQHEYYEIDYQALSDKLDKEAEEDCSSSEQTS